MKKILIILSTVATLILLSGTTSAYAACIPGNTSTGDYPIRCVDKGYICQQTNECPASAPATQVGPLDLGKLNETIFGEGKDPSKLPIGNTTVDYTTPRGIISALLPYLFTLAGLILFVMIIWGGFEMLTGAANPKSQEAGKQRLTAGIIGFLLIFSAYWLAQILQTVFGISILK